LTPSSERHPQVQTKTMMKQKVEFGPIMEIIMEARKRRKKRARTRIVNSDLGMMLSDYATVGQTLLSSPRSLAVSETLAGALTTCGNT
jgi:hypothetical protein